MFTKIKFFAKGVHFSFDIFMCLAVISLALEIDKRNKNSQNGNQISYKKPWDVRKQHSPNNSPSNPVGFC